MKQRKTLYTGTLAMNRRDFLKTTLLSGVVLTLPGCNYIAKRVTEKQARGYVPDAKGPFNIYIVVAEDTSHAMTVHYSLLNADSEGAVCFDTVSRNGMASAYAQRATGPAKPFVGIPDGRSLYSIELSGLTPGQTYYFIVGNEKSGYSKEMKFRALPDKTEGLRFVTGGDLGVSSEEQALLPLATSYEPAFAIIAGDISYAPRDLTGAREWDIWFKEWETRMVTPQGYVIPMLVGIGNHEVNGDVESERFEDKAPFYMAQWGDQAKTIYYSRRIGTDMVIFMLDSGHLEPHGGAQAEWLAAELEKYKDIPIKIAVYHVPLYPSHRRYEDDGSMVGRREWLPLFDRYNVNVAFEHHDHTFKRTHRLRNGKVDPEGTLYLGDGCWGREPRTVAKELRWYLAKADSTAHFWVTDVTQNALQFRAITTDGKVFDECSLPVRTLPSVAPVAPPVSKAPGVATEPVAVSVGS